VGVSVQSSKNGDCPAGANAQVEVADLQEMHNRFREQLDIGLRQLADNQGKNGPPAAPDISTSAAVEVPMPEPDQDAQPQLQDLQNEADKADADVDVNQPPAPGIAGTILAIRRAGFMSGCRL
jgi:hypothetical protein